MVFNDIIMPIAISLTSMLNRRLLYFLCFSSWMGIIPAYGLDLHLQELPPAPGLRPSEALDPQEVAWATAPLPHFPMGAVTVMRLEAGQDVVIQFRERDLLLLKPHREVSASVPVMPKGAFRVPLVAQKAQELPDPLIDPVDFRCR